MIILGLDGHVVNVVEPQCRTGDSKSGGVTNVRTPVELSMVEVIVVLVACS